MLYVVTRLSTCYVVDQTSILLMNLTFDILIYTINNTCVSLVYQIWLSGCYKRQKLMRTMPAVGKLSSLGLFYLITMLAARTHGQFVHHSNRQMYALMKIVAYEFPEITRIYTIGKSVQGRDLMVIEISDNPGRHEPGEPEFKYVANMHGNEVTGRETLLHLIVFLCMSYGHDPEVTQLINTTRIHILPSMNPDGYQNAYDGLVGRTNANGKDLNRDFPDHFQRNVKSFSEMETRAVRNWLREYPFVLSANFHNGGLAAIYPYDSSPSGKHVYTPTPDDDIFQKLAQTYSKAHPTMYLGIQCHHHFIHHTLVFPDGISNGAALYSVDGTMQDYNYLHSNCFEIMIEQGCVRFPHTSELEGIWNANKAPLLAFIHQVHRGVKGFVKDVNDKPIAGATIHVVGRNHSVTSATDGDYWRLLLPGVYTIVVTADRYRRVQAEVVVANESVTKLNFTLYRLEQPKEASYPAPSAVTDETLSSQTIPTSSPTSHTSEASEISTAVEIDTTQETHKVQEIEIGVKNPLIVENTFTELSGDELTTETSDMATHSFNFHIAFPLPPATAPSQQGIPEAAAVGIVWMLVAIFVLVATILTLTIVISCLKCRYKKPIHLGFVPVSMEIDVKDNIKEHSPQNSGCGQSSDKDSQEDVTQLGTWSNRDHF